jgi:hypothetical protein
MSADWEPRDQGAEEHVTDLLSAYVRNRLAGDADAQIQQHLAICSVCRDDYALATAVTEAAQRRLQAVPAPSLALLDQVWREIDTSAPYVVMARSAKRKARLLWHVTRAQLPLIPKGIWIASAAVLFIAVLLASVWRDGAFPPSLLGLLLAPMAAAGVAVLCDQDADAGLEIALATPTSPRVTLFCRFLLVYGYNTALALGGVLFLTLAHHADFALLTSFWLGPMLLLASSGLVLTVRFGAFVGAIVVGALWCLRALGLVWTSLHATVEINATLPILWRTTPALIALSLALLVIAVMSLPTEFNAARDH